MEGNIIFLVGDDSLGYLAGLMDKKYFMTFIWGHPFSTCRSYDKFFEISHTFPCANMYAFRVPPPFAYVISLIW